MSKQQKNSPCSPSRWNIEIGGSHSSLCAKMMNNQDSIEITGEAKKVFYLSDYFSVM